MCHSKKCARWASRRFTHRVCIGIVIPVLFFASNIHAQESWGQWLLQSVQQHPDVIAARERMGSDEANADALAKPLFNPELETEVEQHGDVNNYRVGISQRIDLWNQRGAQQQQAAHVRSNAAQIYQLSLSEKLTQALSQLIELSAATEVAEIARQQETQIQSLIEFVQQRQQAGDLGEVDAALSRFSLSRQLQETAEAQVRLQTIQALLQDLLPELSNTQADIPGSLWQVSIANDIDTWIDQHPRVVAAKAEWESLQQAALATQRENKASPTIGINTGKEDEENIVALNVSIPLNIRNNYSAQYRAATQLALAAEANYRALRRQQRARFNESYAQLQEYQRAYQRWQTLVSGQIDSSADLLEEQWRAGDLGTADYLLALQQRAEGLAAGIELRRAYHQAIIDCLLNSGQLRQTLVNL